MVQPQVGAALGWIAYYGFGLAALYASASLFFLYLDLLGLSMLVSVFVIIWRSLCLRRAIQVCSLLIITLVMMVSLAAPQDFFVYVTFSQFTYNFVPWFTNADLLLVASSVLALTMLFRPQGQAEPARRAQNPMRQHLQSGPGEPTQGSGLKGSDNRPQVPEKEEG